MIIKNAFELFDQIKRTSGVNDLDLDGIGDGYINLDNDSHQIKSKRQMTRFRKVCSVSCKNIKSVIKKIENNLTF